MGQVHWTRRYMVFSCSGKGTMTAFQENGRRKLNTKGGNDNWSFWLVEPFDRSWMRKVRWIGCIEYLGQVECDVWGSTNRWSMTIGHYGTKCNEPRWRNVAAAFWLHWGYFGNIFRVSGYLRDFFGIYWRYVGIILRRVHWTQWVALCGCCILAALGLFWEYL